MLKSEFIKDISYRGYMHQCTDLDALDKLCKSQSIAAYIGFDLSLIHI